MPARCVSLPASSAVQRGFFSLLWHAVMLISCLQISAIHLNVMDGSRVPGSHPVFLRIQLACTLTRTNLLTLPDMKVYQALSLRWNSEFLLHSLLDKLVLLLLDIHQVL